MLTRLRLTRLDKELIQLQLGIKAEVHPTKISLAERKLTILDPDEEERLASALGVEKVWLFEDAPEVLPFGGLGRRRYKEKTTEVSL